MRNLAIVGVVVLAALGLAVWFNMGGQDAVPLKEGAAGAPLVAVQVPELSAAAQQGKQTFEQYCAACHGKNAAGQEGVAPPLVHKIYEPGHHGDRAFYMAALNGAKAHHWPFGDMPSVEGITQDEVAEIITYVRELQRANGIE